jgi:hypothetical protein
MRVDVKRGKCRKANRTLGYAPLERLDLPICPPRVRTLVLAVLEGSAPLRGAAHVIGRDHRIHGVLVPQRPDAGAYLLGKSCGCSQAAT